MKKWLVVGLLALMAIFVIIFNFESLFGRTLPDLGFSLPSFVNLAVWGSFKAGITEGNGILAKCAFWIGKYLWFMLIVIANGLMIWLYIKGIVGLKFLMILLGLVVILIGLIFSPLLTILVIIILFVCSLGYYWYKKRKP